MCARILEDLEGLLAALLDVVVNFTFCTAALAAEACDADFCDTATSGTKILRPKVTCKRPGAILLQRTPVAPRAPVAS